MLFGLKKFLGGNLFALAHQFGPVEATSNEYNQPKDQRLRLFSCL